ncbi:shikimate kinase AroL, partial [Salmonella enterica]|uniref:shikimate kinase AroL n=1 Tax=Salmonella enterica TaxID=28901 RepID=UPI0009AF0E26
MMQPLYLVGPRGCGKTTIGMALAQATGFRFADTDRFRFADTDRWLQSHVQMSVADIVEKEGWGGFRARETAALEAVSAPSTVVATGGGIILTEYNRRYMHRVGVVIYLCAPVSTLVNRLEAEPEADLR